MVTGDVGYCSRIGRLGLGGLKSAGSEEVGSTVFDMASPMLVKKIVESLRHFGRFSRWSVINA